MMPYDSYRLYQVEHLRTAAEARRADEQAGRLAAAVARLVRGVTRPARPAPRPHLAVVRAACPPPQNRLAAGAE